MVTGIKGALSLSHFFDRPFLRLALAGALVASLGLAACGRKGPLDPPPGASLDSGPAPIGGEAKDGNPGVGPDGQPRAPKGPEKHIFLDGLLN